MARGGYADYTEEQKKEDALYRKRHSLSHILAQAVLQHFPGTKLGFGPPVDNGFYYDFLLEKPIHEDDLELIEESMRAIIAEKQVFESYDLPVAQAVAKLESEGEYLKAEYAKELGQKDEVIGFYKNGPFEDMCAGPHVDNTGEIDKACFKLDSIAGSYWRGDETREVLVRIYGLAFNNKKELRVYQKQREEAKKFDHRKLGKELELFTFNDAVGPGLPIWLPNGTVLRDELEKLAKEKEFEQGYDRVSTPQLTDSHLFEQSGHLAHYKDAMFPPMHVDENREYYLRPMNCPFHHLVFANRPRSYRELPIRLGEHGQVYRYEKSGVLSGLLRVRAMCQNDAHIYCTEDQLAEEIEKVLELHDFYYKKFRLDCWMRLSLHDPNNKKKYVDNPKAWSWSEELLRNVLEESGHEYEVGFDEAAFYGPKIDFQVGNVLGREETASTCQLDFAQPHRFNLSYIGPDGQEHIPYCIHRAPLGTHERFVGFLTEHFKGAFPTWMAPTQVRVVPVHLEHYGGYATEVVQALRAAGVRASADLGTESLGKKIRGAVTHKTPNILVVGEEEQQAKGVMWRRYASKEQTEISLERFVATMKVMIDERTMDNFEDISLPVQ